MFGSLWCYYKVLYQLFLLTIPILLLVTSDESNNSFPQGYSSLQTDTSNLDRESTSFIYISFTGRKYFKQALKSDYIIETYRLPVTVYYDLKMLTSLPAKEKVKSDRKINRILYPYKEEMKTYGIKYLIKYKQFYPRGLHTGDFISEQEFNNWDFNEPYQPSNLIRNYKSNPIPWH